MQRSLLLILASGLFASAAAAQTNDHIYRDWRWQEDPGSPRAAGQLLMAAVELRSTAPVLARGSETKGGA